MFATGHRSAAEGSTGTRQSKRISRPEAGSPDSADPGRRCPRPVIAAQREVRPVSGNRSAQVDRQPAVPIPPISVPDANGRLLERMVRPVPGNRSAQVDRKPAVPIPPIPVADAHDRSSQRSGRFDRYPATEAHKSTGNRQSRSRRTQPPPPCQRPSTGADGSTGTRQPKRTSRPEAGSPDSADPGRRCPRPVIAAQREVRPVSGNRSAQVDRQPAVPIPPHPAPPPMPTAVYRSGWFDW